MGTHLAGQVDGMVSLGCARAVVDAVSQSVLYIELV